MAHTTPAETVRHITECIRSTHPVSHYQPTAIEQDDNTAPAGTTAYEGRALAFHCHTWNGREIRVTVEDVTLDEG